MDIRIETDTLWLGETPIALDDDNKFRPNKAVWDLWNKDKLAVKQSGVFITKEGDKWVGRVDTQNGFSYTKSDLHAMWIRQAEALAKSEDLILPPVVERDEIKYVPMERFPQCLHRETYIVKAKRLINGAYQIRLQCQKCDRLGQSVSWEDLKSAITVMSLASEIQANKGQINYV